YVTPRVILTDNVCGEYAYQNEIKGNIYNSTPPNAGFTTDYDSICQGVPIQFTDTSKSPDPIYDIASWKWSFGSTAENDSSLVQNPTFAYNEDGNHSPQLVVYNELGCSDTLNDINRIRIYSNVLLTSDFDVSNNLVCPWEEVSVTSDASAGIHEITKYEWNFGNGFNKEGEKSSYSFADSLKGKEVAIIHKVTDDKLCTDTTAHTVVINNLQAAFGYEPQPVTRGSAVDYSDESTTDNGTTVTSWKWTFEGSTTAQSSEQNPEDVPYPNILADQSTRLIVGNNIGCIDTTIAQFDVENNPPDLDTFRITLVENYNYIFNKKEFNDNYSDKDNHALESITIASNPANGSFKQNGFSLSINTPVPVNQISELEFIPISDWNGETSFLWNGYDGRDWSDYPKTVHVTVLEEPEPPTLETITIEAPEDSILDITRQHFIDHIKTVLGSSFSFDSLRIISNPENGDLTFNGNNVNTPQLILENEIDNQNNVLKFTPDHGFSDTTTFMWNAHDGYHFGDENGVVELNYYNTPPVLTDITRDNIKEDELQFFNQEDFEAHYSDRDQYDKAHLFRVRDLPPVDEGKFTYRGNLITNETTINFSNVNDIRFDPAIGFEGTTEATWGISDGNDFGYAKLTMTFVNAPPEISDFTVNGAEDTPLAFNESDFESAFYDEYRYDYLSDIIIHTLPDYGTLELADSTLMPGDSISNEDIDKITYVPNADWNGSDSFIYNAKDGTDWAENDAIVYIEIAAVNDAPRTKADYYTIPEDEKLDNVSVATNDTDIDDEITALQYHVEDSDSASAGFNGTIELDNTGYLNYIPAANFNGEVYFIYTVCDDEPDCAKDTVFINIIPVNDPPAAVADTFHINEDVNNKSFNFLLNDEDYDGDNFNVTNFNNDTVSNINVKLGQISWNKSGDLNFTMNEENDTLAAGETIQEQYTYTITDDSLNNSQGDITIIIHGINNIPVAESDIITTTENFNLIISDDQPYQSLLQNDSDVEGADLSIYEVENSDTSAINTEFGIFNWQPDGSWSFTEDTTATNPIPEGGSQQVTFQYNISDGIDISDKAWITININGRNDKPAAINDTLTIYEDEGTVTINTGRYPAMLFNDYDVDINDTFVVTRVNNSSLKNTNGNIGTLEWDNDGSFAYTPNVDTAMQLGDGQQAEDIFTYEIKDEERAFNTAKLVVIVKGKNDAPFAQNDSISIYEDTNETFVESVNGLLANDGDIDHDPIVVAVNGVGTSTLSGEYGILEWDSTGTYTYNTFVNIVDTLYHNEKVLDIFTYQVFDPSGATDQAELHITIIGENDAPVAVNHHDSMMEDDETLTVSKRNEGMLAEDSDIDDNNNFGVVSIDNIEAGTISGKYGSLEWQYDGTYYYTLNIETDTLAENEIVIDSFEYHIEDAYDSTAIAWFYIEITGNNDNPLAKDNTLRIDENVINESPSWSLLDNDEDVDGDDISLQSLNESTTSPVTSKFASFTWNDEGYFEYQRYIHDHKKDGLDTLAWDDVISDSIPYTITDTQNLESQAYLHLIIQGRNDAPLTERDYASIIESEEQVTGNILSNDIDVDRRDAISLRNINKEEDYSTEGIFGTLTWEDAGTFIYHNNFEATDSLIKDETVYDYFPYTIFDKLGKNATDTLEITIIGENDDPVAVADTIYITESDIETSIHPEDEGVLSNDYDIDGTALQVVLPGTEQPHNVAGIYGTFSINTNGHAGYTLNTETDTLAAGEIVTDKFVYTITDTNGALSSSHVIFIITGENDNPVANNDFYSTNEDTDSIFVTNMGPDAVLNNDTDIDNDDLFIISVNDTTAIDVKGKYGNISWLPDGTFVYYNNKEQTDSLTEGETVIQSFSYIITDANGGNDTAKIHIEIIGINDAPVALADTFSTTEYIPLTAPSPNANGILYNDTDVDGELQTVTKIQHQTEPASNDTIYGEWGKLIWKSDGGFTYYPDTALTISLRSDQSVMEYFNYEIEDEFCASDTSTIQIKMQRENNAPLAKNDTIVIFESEIKASISDIRKNDIEFDNNDTLKVATVDYETNQVITGTYGELFWNQNG
ncbi:MAG: Ig-like domain-containing protein, partial [Prolixibacteraceae bacterium]|nr:Ig-like domain-containing protein [Prolixibacteraceae bacterium]